MRQIVAFYPLINKRLAKDRYETMKFQAKLIRGIDLPDLESLSEGVETQNSAFKQDMAEAMEKRARELVEERRWQANGR